MTVALAFFFLICLLTQLGYLGAATRLLARSAAPAAPPVATSVVVCAHNARHHLAALLAALLAQDHPDFEVVVVDDRSTDGTWRWLQNAARHHARLRPLRVVQTPPGVNGKKHALSRGLAAARGTVVVLTDADCRPAGPTWVRLMQQQLTAGHDVVLGYAPYYPAPGLLNRLICFETFATAVQFMTFAAWKRAYMGVGRNLAYRRSLFHDHGGLQSHQHVTGGDDDLFVNAVARPGRVALCLAPGARTFSWPKRSWQTWYRQKRRHLSVGRHYRRRDQLRLAALALTHAGCWLVGAGLLFTDWWELATFGVTLRAGVQMVVYRSLARRWHERLPWLMVPFFDLLFVFYYPFFTLPALFSKRIQWT